MTLSEAMCRSRRERLLAQVTAETVLIGNPRHVQYLSGYWSTPLHAGSWCTPHLLIDGATGYTTLLAHDFAPDTGRAFVDRVETWHWYDGLHAPYDSLFPAMASALRHHLRGTLATEAGWLPHGLTDEPVTDITQALLTMRRRKDPDELAMLRACVRAVEAGHRAARATIRPGVTEIDVYNAVYAAICAEAGEPVQPLGDFASGERAYAIGGPPTARTLAAGEVMIVDVFPVIGGYRADFTATYAVSGPLSDTQRHLEAALHDALAAGEALLRPGVAGREVYAAVKAVLDDRGYVGAFPHHAGHGLGLGHPEAPFLVPDSSDRLEAGDVITLEPGAYGAGFGGRIEHNYLITESGFERLTGHDTRFVAS